jgi:hypothetical protein
MANKKNNSKKKAIKFTDVIHPSVISPVSMLSGGISRKTKYNNGGGLGDPPPRREPIYVDPNDPAGRARYQAYQDSADLYNYSILQGQLEGSRASKAPYEGSVKAEEARIKRIQEEKNLNHVGNLWNRATGQALTDYNETTPLSTKSDFKLYGIGKDLIKDNSDFYWSNPTSSPDIAHRNIEPIGVADGIARNYVYAEPVQPIEYAKGKEAIKNEEFVKTKPYVSNLDTDLSAYLKSIGEDASYAARKKRYEATTGKTDYKGSAEQNMSLLQSIKNPKVEEPVVEQSYEEANTPQEADVIDNTPLFSEHEEESQPSLKETHRGLVNDVHRELNPYTNQYEGMSPAQKNMLERAKFKGEPQPSFAPEYIDANSRRPIENPYGYSETGKQEFANGGNINNTMKNKKKYSMGGFHQPGGFTYGQGNPDQAAIRQDVTDPSGIDRGLSTGLDIAAQFIPGGSLINQADKMMSGLAEGFASGNNNKIMASNIGGSISPLGAMKTGVSNLQNKDLSLGQKALGFFPGVGGYIKGKDEQRRYGEEMRDQMWTTEREEFGAAPKTMYSYGGDMGVGNDPATSPSGENIDFNEYEGATHDEGGIPIGPDAEVEGGEVRVEDYIFSDRLQDPITGKTFAEAAKKVQKKYSGRQNDAPSNRAMEKELTALMTSNDMAKQIAEQEEKMQAQALAEEAGIDPSQMGGQEQMGMEQGQMPMGNEGMPMGMDQGMEEGVPQEFAYGGRMKYPNGGDLGKTAMMKARLAYAEMHGNPAAKRMVSGTDNPYDFGDGSTGTHYMASMDNYAVPQIQEGANGDLELGDFNPSSREAMRFDSSEDAEYFSENYKKVSPALKEYKNGGKMKYALSGGIGNPNWDEIMLGAASPQAYGIPNPTMPTGINPGEPLLNYGDQSAPRMQQRRPTGVDNPINPGDAQFRDMAPLYNPDDFPGTDGDVNTKAGGLNLGDEAPDYNKTDKLAYAASNLAAIDNLANSMNVEKSRTPRVNLERLDMSDARLNVARESATQGAIQRRNIRGASSGSGQALSNLAAGSASLADNAIGKFLQTYGMEAQTNQQTSNQERMYNTQAEAQERIQNEQNRAAGKMARNTALADVGQNTGLYTRDQKATAENERFNQMQFKLINDLYPNYSFMTPEQKRDAEFNVQTFLRQGNMMPYFTAAPSGIAGTSKTSTTKKG